MFKQKVELRSSVLLPSSPAFAKLLLPRVRLRRGSNVSVFFRKLLLFDGSCRLESGRGPVTVTVRVRGRYRDIETNYYVPFLENGPSLAVKRH